MGDFGMMVVVGGDEGLSGVVFYKTSRIVLKIDLWTNLSFGILKKIDFVMRDYSSSFRPHY